VNSPVWHTVFYLSIITWETATMILCWLGGFMMARALRKAPAAFHQAKRMAISALTVSLLMWLVVFLSVGGEWFLMWQSKIWNGQDAAFRMFAVIGIILLLVIQPESEAQP
jgi:predicted small integral membrane protein